MRRGLWGAALGAAVTVALLAPGVRAGGAEYKSVLIKDVPHVRQKPDFCGEACAEMFLRKLGKKMDQDYVFNRSGADPLLGRGCNTAELGAALKNIGFRTGDVWGKVKAASAAQEMEKQWQALHADLAAGVPSIICMRTSADAAATEHFRLMLGYDAERDEVIYHEPAEDAAAYRRMARKQMLELWPLKYEKDQWTVIRLRPESGEMEAPKPTAGFTNADFAQHMMKLKGKVPDGFAVVLEPPFVVIGDDSKAAVKRSAENTVRWACRMLKRDYFAKDPIHIMDIWLFKDKASYEKHTSEIFGDRPSTPFGYCSKEHDALIMNIGTGGGTLVHEIVHAFLESNFPQYPAWFSEGLASLYEQCMEKDGHICGLTNWRLEGLQKAIKAGEVPSFKTLTHASSDDFYNRDRGTNYAQARYLCYYLQEKGLLRTYYKAFVENCKTDPTGYETLKKALAEEDMDAFKKKWEAFVLKLQFP